MKKMIVLMIGLGVILGGCRKKEKQEAASGQAAPEILVNRPAQHDVVYTYQYPAYLEAVQTVNLVARVSGFLEKMNYIPGVPVKAGQLLFVIEPQPYQDQLKAAQAEMKSTEARLAYARAQYEKMKEAMPSRAISEIDFIQAESDYHSECPGTIEYCSDQSELLLHQSSFRRTGIPEPGGPSELCRRSGTTGHPGYDV